jgi:BirA family transcriptional regulator, biotin operon repressor / biotin---[acetyl-CoA-carboxylase] ligase
VSIDAKLLTLLRSAGDGGISGVGLSEELHLSRAAVWARIEDLRQLGYEVEASPHLGYRLVKVPDLLHADDLLARLGETRVVGRDIRVFEETTSTNDVVERLARDGVKEGVVVFAESQTKGRGRLGRSWQSPAKKGLWFSVLLRPDMRPQETTRLTVAAAAALARAIESEASLTCDIKWPNDLMIRGRKVAGILTELSAELDHVKYVILGMGVDVNQGLREFAPELRKIATSLRIESGQAVDRAALATTILRELDRDYARVCTGEFEAVADDWSNRCTTLGQEVVISIGSRRISGHAEALDNEGVLLVRTEHGLLERVTGGDLTQEKVKNDPSR